MKRLLGTTLALIFSASAFSQTIEFTLKDHTIDYGTVARESGSARSFEFKNTGKAPLVISTVKSNCGCALASAPKSPIMPGQSGKIDVSYNMQPGRFSKTLAVHTNALNLPNGSVTLRIKGEITNKN